MSHEYMHIVSINGWAAGSSGRGLHTVRLPLTSVPILMCALAAAAQTGSDVPKAPDDGGPWNWEVSSVSRAVNFREKPSTKAPIAGSFRLGTILDNLGWQRADERFWCNVQRSGGGPRGFVSTEFLKPAVSPDGSVATGPDDSALRAGQGKFDPTGRIPCAQAAGQPMTECEFGVARAGSGYAAVVIKRPRAPSRSIFFRMGKPVGADTSQADGYLEFCTPKQSDLHMIHIGNERHEIPDAVIQGG